MSQWWTYTLQDLLLFSPRVYWRMFELHNRAVWPAQIPALLLGAAILVLVVHPRPWSGRVISAILAGAWTWVAWTFHWNRYSAINWAAAYAVPVFAVEALLLGWVGLLNGRGVFSARRSASGAIGLLLLAYALVLHPFVANVSGRPLQSAEIFGIAPDPTVIATLGVLTLASDGTPARLLLPVPLAWCVASWATLYALAAPEAWIPLAAAVVAVTSRVWPAPHGQTARTSAGELRR
jgi:hypothetical protein